MSRCSQTSCSSFSFPFHLRASAVAEAAAGGRAVSLPLHPDQETINSLPALGILAGARRDALARLYLPAPASLIMASPPREMLENIFRVLEARVQTSPSTARQTRRAGRCHSPASLPHSNMAECGVSQGECVQTPLAPPSAYGEPSQMVTCVSITKYRSHNSFSSIFYIILPNLLRWLRTPL